MITLKNKVRLNNFVYKYPNGYVYTGNALHADARIGHKVPQQIRAASDSDGVFGTHIYNVRKIKNGISYELHFASHMDSKYNYTVRYKLRKNK